MTLPPTLLIVDDEEMLRELAREILVAAGYEVRTASGAEAALALAADRPPRLLITDVCLPDLGGPELAARLRAEHPRMGVLFVSGHPLAVANREIESVGASGEFLQKPYSREALVSSVARAVARTVEPPG